MRVELSEICDTGDCLPSSFEVGGVYELTILLELSVSSSLDE